MKRLYIAIFNLLCICVCPVAIYGGITVAILMAGYNDLERFTIENLNQLVAVGSTDDLLLFVQLENYKGTHRYIVEKGKLTLINHLDPTLKPRNNTGDPETFINFLRFCIHYKPGNEVIAGFWDHGTGPLEPYPTRAVQLDDLCTIVTAHKYSQVKKYIRDPFFEELPKPLWKGVCFDDGFKSFLSEEKLDYCLNAVCQNYLPQGFALILFDACLEANISTAHIVKKYARYMAGSEEVVLGPGINYTKTFGPLSREKMSIDEFARHIVKAYEETYKHTFSSYTFSALDMQYMQQLEDTINHLGTLLIQALKDQQHSSVTDTIKKCAARSFCVSFDQPDYIDLGNFCRNLQANLTNFKLKRKPTAISQIAATLEETLQALNKVVIARCAGSKKARAEGLSIYFPTKKIHPSFKKSLFAKKIWLQFLMTLLL